MTTTYDGCAINLQEIVSWRSEEARIVRGGPFPEVGSTGSFTSVSYRDDLSARIMETLTMYSLENSDSIKNYIQEWPHLIEIMKKAKPIIEELFPGAKVRLGLFYNPEDSVDDNLTFNIEYIYEPSVFVEKLEQLNMRIFSSLSPSQRSRFIFMPDHGI